MHSSKPSGDLSAQTIHTSRLPSQVPWHSKRISRWQELFFFFLTSQSEPPEGKWRANVGIWCQIDWFYQSQEKGHKANGRPGSGLNRQWKKRAGEWVVTIQSSGTALPAFCPRAFSLSSTTPHFWLCISAPLMHSCESSKSVINERCVLLQSYSFSGNLSGP